MIVYRTLSLLWNVKQMAIDENPDIEKYIYENPALEKGSKSVQELILFHQLVFNDRV
jgi:hypothetical protein